MTGTNRDSNEPANEIADPISEIEALSYMTHTVLAQSQTGKLTEKAKTDFFDKLSKALDVAAYISEGPSETTTQEVQAIRREDGSSSAHPLDVDGPLDVDRNHNLMSFEDALGMAHFSKSPFRIE